VLSSLPITAHTGIALTKHKKPGNLFRYVSVNQEDPITAMTASHPDYRFHLILSSNIYLAIEHIPTNRVRATGLPNTWDDGRCCMGTDFDTWYHANRGVPALNFYLHWSKLVHNHHLREAELDNLAGNLATFWQFEPPPTPATWTPRGLLPPFELNSNMLEIVLL
jgi:hypothetical protein